MTLRVLAEVQVQSDALATLELGDTPLEVTSREALAAGIRRAAGFLCPCSARTLVSAVTGPLHGLVEDDYHLEVSVEDALAALLAIGDLQECRNVASNRVPLIYLTPPGFVRLGNTIALLGVVPDQISPLPEDLALRVQYKGCLRYLREEPRRAAVGSSVTVQDLDGEIEQYTIVLPSEADPVSGRISVNAPVGRSLLNRVAGDEVEFVTPSGISVMRVIEVEDQTDVGADEDLVSYLSQVGLVELSQDYWLRAPPDETPDQHIERYQRALERALPCGDVPGISILDTNRPVRYYRGRWASPSGLDGNFVARRPQAYGNDLWCYVEIDSGSPRRLIDLPISADSGARGCDEAWRLQAAIDAQRGEPQQYRLRQVAGGANVVDLFSPPPGWAERRWTWVGQRVDSVGCLMSFQFRIDGIEEELDFAKRKLWLSQSPEQ